MTTTISLDKMFAKIPVEFSCGLKRYRVEIDPLLEGQTVVETRLVGAKTVLRVSENLSHDDQLRLTIEWFTSEIAPKISATSRIYFDGMVAVNKPYPMSGNMGQLCLDFI